MRALRFLQVAKASIWFYTVA